MKVADLPIGGQRHCQDRVAVVHFRKVKPGVIAHRTGEALNLRIVGQQMPGIGDLGHPIGLAGGRAKEQNGPQRKAYTCQESRSPAPNKRTWFMRNRCALRQESFRWLKVCARLNRFHGSDESVASLGQRLNKARVLCLIAERLTELVYGNTKAVVEVDRGVLAPKLPLQRLTRDDFSRIGRASCRERV